MSCLPMSDKRFVGECIKPHSHTRWSGIGPLGAGVVSIAGLVLFVSATSFALRDLSDYVFQWVMLPGGACGILLIASGIGVLVLQHRQAEEQKLCSILKKIIGAEDPTGQSS